MNKVSSKRQSQGPIAKADPSLMIYDKIEDKTAFVDVMGLPVYDFIDHTYYGRAGYRDRSYLVPHPRETSYNTRRRIASYINIFKPVTDCMIDPVFAEEVKREFDNNFYGQFVENCDNCGTTLTAMNKEIIKDANLKDISFCVMDNFSSEDLAGYATSEEAMAARKFPYVQMKTAQEAKAFKTNRFGALESIDFVDEVVEVIQDGKKPKEVQTYKRWDAQGWMTYSLQSTKSGEEVEVMIKEGTHGLGFIPVYPVLDFCATKSMKKLSEPRMTDLATLCFALFNKESLASELEYYQCFSILYLSGLDAASVQALGPSNFISVSSDSKFTPGFASPDPSHLVNIVRNCDRFEEKIYKYAQQKGVIAVKSAASGVSKDWDFRAEEVVLKLTSKAWQSLENWQATTFAAYIKSQFTYNVTTPDCFRPNKAQNDIDQSLKIIDMQPPEPLKLREWKNIAIAQFGTDEETGDTLIEELDADAEAKKMVVENMKKMAEADAAAQGPQDEEGESTNDNGAINQNI